MGWQVFGWGLVALGLSPIAFGLSWPIWQGMIRPRFIPRRDIERLADDVMAKHPDDPETAALRAEHYHWYRSEGFEQGRWRRVRNEVRRRRRYRDA